VSNDKRWICRQQGFTLIEVMVALLIFMVIALGLARGEIAALRAQTDNVLRDEATRLAEEQLNDLRGQPFTNLAAAPWTNPESLPVTMRAGRVVFARSFQIIEIDATATQLMRIDVAVGWNQGNNPPEQPVNTNHQVLLSTIIARGDE